MKALEKDRNRRYETASGFAADIERHLHDDPVEAGPPSAAYRFRKFARRNKRTLAAAALLALVLVLGSVISTWQALRAEAQRQLAQQKAAEAERSAETARAETAKANAVVTLLQEMLGSADPDQAKGATYTIRQLMDDFSAGLGNDLAGQPEVEASIRGTVGLAYRLLELPDQAEPNLKRALHLRRGIYGPKHEMVADILVNQAWNQIARHRFTDAEADAREAVEIYRGAGVKGRPLVRALWILHNALSLQQRRDETEVVGDEAIALARESPEGEFPEVANILHRRAQIRLEQRKYAEAEHLARQAVDMHRRLHGSDHRETAWALNFLGQALYRQDKLPEAEAALREALAIFRRVYDQHYSIEATTFRLQEVLRARDDRAGLEALARQQLQEATDAIHQTAVKPWLKRARAHNELQELEQALNAYGMADAAAQDFDPKTRSAIARELLKLAETLRAQQKPIEAERAQREATLILKQLGQDVPSAQAGPVSKVETTEPATTTAPQVARP
jgi:tetratricopeptide (TPR) repeat protein